MSSESDRPGALAWRSEVIRDHLTAERLGSYLADCNDNLDEALGLYEWNMQVAAGAMTATGMVEVVVRNALDAALTNWASSRTPGTGWLVVAPLDAQGKADVAKAKSRASRRASKPPHGKVIAELNFGFWRYLVASRYLASLWVPAAHLAFPLGEKDLRLRRVRVEQDMQSLHFLRNRAAHHEPLHRRNLVRDADAVESLLSRISVDASNWAAANSHFRRLISERPGGE